MPEDRSIDDFDRSDVDSKVSDDDPAGNQTSERMELVSLEQWERDSEPPDSWIKKSYMLILWVFLWVFNTYMHIRSGRSFSDLRRSDKGTSRCLYIDIEQWREHSKVPDRHPKTAYQYGIPFLNEGTRIEGDELRYDHKSRCLFIRYDEIITVKNVVSCRTPVQRATILSALHVDGGGAAPITELCSECDISVDELKDIVRAKRGIEEVSEVLNKDNYTERTEKPDENWTIEDIHRINWRQFEYLLSELWSDNGYTTTVTSSSSDQGIDVTAKNDSERIAIQAKQNSKGNRVGNRVIRNTAGVLPRGFDRAIIVTSSSFTEPAKKEAQEYGKQVSLIDSRLLLQELNDSNLNPRDFNSLN